MPVAKHRGTQLCWKHIASQCATATTACADFAAAMGKQRPSGPAPPPRLTAHQRQIMERLIDAHGDNIEVGSRPLCCVLVARIAALLSKSMHHEFCIVCEAVCTCRKPGSCRMPLRPPVCCRPCGGTRSSMPCCCRRQSWRRCCSHTGCMTTMPGWTSGCPTGVTNGKCESDAKSSCPAGSVVHLAANLTSWGLEIRREETTCGFS